MRSVGGGGDLASGFPDKPLTMLLQSINPITHFGSVNIIIKRDEFTLCYNTLNVILAAVLGHADVATFIPKSSLDHRYYSIQELVAK